MNNKLKSLLMKPLEGMISSKKFWYAVSAIVIPIVSHKLGLSETEVQNVFYAILSLLGGQALADLGKEKKG